MCDPSFEIAQFVLADATITRHLAIHKYQQRCSLSANTLIDIDFTMRHVPDFVVMLFSDSSVRLTLSVIGFVRFLE